MKIRTKTDRLIESFLLAAITIFILAILSGLLMLATVYWQWFSMWAGMLVLLTGVYYIFDLSEMIKK